MAHIGYKLAERQRLVKLEILGTNNEGREGLINPDEAQYHCTQARVLAIYHATTRRSYRSATSCFDPNFRYQVGAIVAPSNPTGPEAGIYYYLEEERARTHNGPLPQQEGVLEDYDSDGQLLGRYHYHQGQREGLAETWDSRRPKPRYAQCHYHEGQLEGEWRQIYSDTGQPCAYGHYRQGRREGYWRTWYANGQLKTQEHYRQGQREGRQYEWHANGQLEAVGAWQQGRQEGLAERFWPTGARQVYCHYRQGKYHGRFRRWGLDGTLLEAVHYRHGQPGHEFHQYRHLRIHRDWQGDHCQGHSTWSLRSLRIHCHFRGHRVITERSEKYQEFRHGPAYVWHVNGSLHKVAHYRDDRLHGLAETYNDNGQLLSRHYYNQGQRCRRLPTDVVTLYKGCKECRRAERIRARTVSNQL